MQLTQQELPGVRPPLDPKAGGRVLSGSACVLYIWTTGLMDTLVPTWEDRAALPGNLPTQVRT